MESLIKAINNGIEKYIKKEDIYIPLLENKKSRDIKDIDFSFDEEYIRIDWMSYGGCYGWEDYTEYIPYKYFKIDLEKSKIIKEKYDLNKWIEKEEEKIENSTNNIKKYKEKLNELENN